MSLIAGAVIHNHGFRGELWVISSEKVVGYMKSFQYFCRAHSVTKDADLQTGFVYGSVVGGYNRKTIFPCEANWPTHGLIHDTSW